MAYPTRTRKRTIGGGQQRHVFRRLSDAMGSVGFNPSLAGSEWLLIANDIHFATNTFTTTDLDAGIRTELLVLAGMPAPQKVVINGDTITDYVQAFGFGPYPVYGDVEIARANAKMGQLSALAGLVTVTGNHDTGPLADPVDGYMLANAPWWTGPNHAWTCGGVHCLATSATHDGRYNAREQAFLNAAFASINDAADILHFAHQPSIGNRVSETGVQAGLLEATPEGMTNRLWHVSGHAHEYNEGVYQWGDTTVVSWVCSCASPDGFNYDGTKPCLSAIACRGGEVVARFSFDAKVGLWTVWGDISRAGAPALPGRLDGLGGTALAEYWEGEYNRSGIILTAANTTWRETGSWMAYVSQVKAVFPIPVGATRFWVNCATAPTLMEMSNSDGSWQTVASAGFNLSCATYNIPAGLLGGPLYIRGTWSSGTIGGWGFA
jgi:hypothetical protein